MNPPKLRLLDVHLPCKTVIKFFGGGEKMFEILKYGFVLSGRKSLVRTLSSLRLQPGLKSKTGKRFPDKRNQGGAK